MAITINQATGWSVYPLYTIEGHTNMSIDSTWAETTATWYRKNGFWDNGWRWAKKFVNIYPTPVKINKIAFYTCTADSGGQTFYSNRTLNSPVSGSACTFYADMYKYGNSRAVQRSTSVRVAKVPGNNCSSVFGKGIADNRAGGLERAQNGNGTQFGNPKYYSGSYGRRYVWLEFTNSTIKLEPGESCFIVLGAQFDSDTILTIISDQTNWKFEIEPANRYIWRFTEKNKWERVLPAWQFDGKEWKMIERSFT